MGVQDCLFVIYNGVIAQKSVYCVDMPVTSKDLKQDIDQLTTEQLQQVADFIAFLKFRDKRRRIVLDPAQLTALATEFAEEDRSLAEAGMGDYAMMLAQEDQ
ncbi:hypothetical protein L3556_08230 [Candidatus Synechococcus calcipolaris G9]|uniref:Uncharacterized protein n=1 Tax=Candidatus Synechococcus calcipolaris G9 TaxID=1497997 RepID=A0ABT6EZ94_9SYNE|nr:hypothetical protein [Candidatus Synechococcus calcipolaris]MDG2990913.1 hypothetical protein [Candidatus Synechococcus calcipolaris G9]